MSDLDNITIFKDLPELSHLSDEDKVKVEEQFLEAIYEFFHTSKGPILEEFRENLKSSGYFKGQDYETLDKSIEELHKQEFLDLLKNSKIFRDNLRTIGLEKFIMPNNKLSNVLAKKDIYNQNASLVTFSGRSKEITTSCLIEYDTENVVFESVRPFTEYDRAVYNAVTSHYVAGNTIMTASMICRAMTGKTKDNSNPSPQQVGAVTRSVKKMGLIRINLDLTNEFQNRGITLDDEHITSYKVSEMLLTYRSVEVLTKGRRIEAFEFLSSPILYSYSKATNQVITVPIKFLDTPIDNTERIINLKNYLIRRIEGIKGKNRLKHDIILFESIYELSENKNKEDNKRTRMQVTRILDYWKEQDYIKNYKFIKQKKSYHSIKISIR